MMPPSHSYFTSAADRKFDVRSVVRGRRLIGWVTGRSPLIWVDTLVGRIAARSALVVGAAMQATYPGPILGHRKQHAPPLSWFVCPDDCISRGGFVAALESQLVRSSDATPKEHIEDAIARVLETDALHIRHRVSPLPKQWHDSCATSRVVLLDERATTHIDYCTSRVSRRAAFTEMVANARRSHPDAQFWLLRSADSGHGTWLSSQTTLPPDTTLLEVDHSLYEMLDRIDAVYVVGASEGMAALLAGIPTHVFGTPYYSGWGLTQDYAAMPERTARPTRNTFFNVVFQQLARYLDSTTGQPGSLDATLDSVALQHSVATRFFDLTAIAALRFQWWKRSYATPYLRAGGSNLRWVGKTGDVGSNETAAVWGGRTAVGLPAGTRVVRIEDGFLHSAGLGSDMSAPYSQVLDFQGIYFDATRPSDLTTILNTTQFDERELERAAALRHAIVRFGLTKYNLGRRAPVWRAPSGRRIALVAGQVADDASIRLGTGSIATTEALLKEVRSRYPDAFIVYKPHPDVMSGNRPGVIDGAKLADIVDDRADLVSLITAVDEVHTLSSLTGFEALLRGKEVYTYGLPFYAGWGLTHDALPQPWRARTLTLDMLTAGVLIRYPIYWDWDLALFTSPEAVVLRLSQMANRPLGEIRKDHKRFFVKAARWSRNVLWHALWHCRHRPTDNSQPRWRRQT
ncbi:capsular polysaccharide biosynthesis protein [Burkholderia cenocepacia]|uniref:capsular polysaccharide biosynthesis protein n=1 Tax=Burkholderia cenocepacia TaxID=95486 RepID=UPI00158D0B1E|nr:capsular biosynthesis protein [Burkholderia cenocepacia]